MSVEGDVYRSPLLNTMTKEGRPLLAHQAFQFIFYLCILETCCISRFPYDFFKKSLALLILHSILLYPLYNPFYSIYNFLYPDLPFPIQFNLFCFIISLFPLVTYAFYNLSFETLPYPITIIL